MEEIKGFYRVSLKWVAVKPLSTGKKQGEFAGQFLMDKNGYCEGYVFNLENYETEHLLVGSIVEGKGLIFTLINAYNPNEKILCYNAYNSDGDNYYGSLSELEGSGTVTKGYTHATIEKLKRDELDESITQNFFNIFENEVYNQESENSKNGYLIINRNVNVAANQINETYERLISGNQIEGIKKLADKQLGE